MARKPKRARKRRAQARKPATSAAGHTRSSGGSKPAVLAELLSKAGLGPITPAMIEKDLAAGAPQGADGTINPFHYAAWLVRASQEAGRAA